MRFFKKKQLSKQEVYENIVKKVDAIVFDDAWKMDRKYRALLLEHIEYRSKYLHENVGVVTPCKTVQEAREEYLNK